MFQTITIQSRSTLKAFYTILVNRFAICNVFDWCNRVVHKKKKWSSQPTWHPSMLGLEIVANDNPASNPREPSTLRSKQTFHDRIGLVIMINDLEICCILCESTTQQKCCYFSTTPSKIFVSSSKFAVALISPSHPYMDLPCDWQDPESVMGVVAEIVLQVPAMGAVETLFE